MLRGERIPYSEERGKNISVDWESDQASWRRALSAGHLGSQGKGALGKSLGMCRGLVYRRRGKKTPGASTLQFTKPSCGHLCCCCS